MGVFFSLFVKGGIFKFNQCCWQQWILNVLDTFKLCNVIGDNGFLK